MTSAHPPFNPPVDQRAIWVWMEYYRLENPVSLRWASHAWRVAMIAIHSETLPVTKEDSVVHCHTGLQLELFRDEAEGYYLNVSAGIPQAFVLWRMSEDTEEGIPTAIPMRATISYNQAARWMDGGEQVEAVPLPPELVPWLSEFIQKHYKPEPKKKRRPASFQSPKNRSGNME